MRLMMYIGGGLVALVVAAVLGWRTFDEAARTGKLGRERDAGEIVGGAVPAAAVIARQEADKSVFPAGEDTRQILFGDIHVHTTYSTDAFMWALPLNLGKGVHPVADACDYARYCSAIDFWAITDHAEASTPLRWARTKESVRQCQARAEDQNNPDLVSFIGFEWTQVGPLPEEHFGHKNVIFLGLNDENVAARPIAAGGVSTTALRANNVGMPGIVSVLDFENRQNYWDFSTFLNNIRKTPSCDPLAASDELPVECFEIAETPGELIDRLTAQGLDPMIIPHGSTWGFYTPPGTTWDKQLRPENRPDAFRLIEIYSGHGNAEEYRDFRAATLGPDGAFAACPPKTPDYTPPCARVGEIIEARCLADGTDAETCATRAADARQASVEMSAAYHLGLGGETPEDWLESGQCKDCYLPAFHHRPLTSVQAGLATSRFEDESDEPIRFNWGFIASSDNHRARPGTGYKEVARRLNTEAAGAVSQEWRDRFLMDDTPADAFFHPRTQEDILANASLALAEFERQSSFWLTGGLAAVHTEGRSREEIWDALQRRETYATSGPRMLLWFDRVDADGNAAPMGATVEAGESGRFKARAVGSFKQKPGCPDYAVDALGAARIEDICAGECYNPTDERYLIERIEIIRIRPQEAPDEDIGQLIDDPFLVHECAPNRDGCDFEFTDESFATGARDALYYARAIQEPRPTINAEPIKCVRDEEGNCLEASLCYGDWRSGDSDCTSLKDVRAWSSPIYLTYRDDLEADEDAPSAPAQDAPSAPEQDARGADDGGQ